MQFLEGSSFFRCAISCTLALLSFRVSAQEIDIASVVVSGYRSISPYAMRLRTTEILSPEEVQKPGFQSAFRQLGDQPLIFSGYDDSYSWFRFTLKNNDSIPHTVMLMVPGLGIRDIEVFQVRGRLWVTKGHSGYKYPFESRPHLFPHYVYPLEIPPKTAEQIFVFVNDRHSYKVEGLFLISPKKLQTVQNTLYFLFGSIVGVLLLFSLFNLYLYLTTRDRIHAWYSVYVVLQSIVILKHEGLDAEFLGLDSELAYRSTSQMGIAALAVAMLIHILQMFLKNIKRNKLMSRTIETVKWVILALTLIHMIVFFIEPPAVIETFVFEALSKSVIVSMILILIVSAYSYLKGFKAALLIVVGLLVYLIGGCMRLLFIYSADYLFQPSLFEIGIAVETIVISFGLMVRYNEYRREREKLSIELAREKYNQVMRVTEALRIDRERIAQDLHDNIGTQLTSVTLGLYRVSRDSQRKIPALDSIHESISNIMVELRNTIWAINRQEVLVDELADKINNLFWRLRNSVETINFQLQIEESAREITLRPAQAINIYRIVQEAVNNAIKHARPNSVNVSITSRNSTIDILIADDGIGFNLGIIDKGSEHFGLTNMHKRATDCQARLLVQSTPGKGTSISIQLGISQSLQMPKDLPAVD